MKVYELPPEPPIGTVGTDKDGDEWTRTRNGWRMGNHDTDTNRWADVMNNAPFTVKPIATVIITQALLDEFKEMLYPRRGVINTAVREPLEILTAAYEVAGIVVDVRALNGEAEPETAP